MLRHAINLWDAFFPTEPIYPTQIIGEPNAQIRNSEELEDVLSEEFVVFTYRDHFDNIKTEYHFVDTDQGWGCLVRSSQMLLAHFLKKFCATSDFKLAYFYDKDHMNAPFSLHNMVKSVWKEKPFKPEYWSPSQGCEAIRKTIENATQGKLLKTEISVVISNNGSLCNEDVANIYRYVRERKIVLILTPVRVSALPQLTQENYLEVERLLTQCECVGMVGGTPGRSYFFFAHNQTQLLYLDPHQRTWRALEHDDELALAQVTPTHNDVRCVHWSRVDTSFFLAFAVQTEREWEKLRSTMSTKFLCIEYNQHKNAYSSLHTPCSKSTLPSSRRENKVECFLPAVNNSEYQTVCESCDEDHGSCNEWQTLNETSNTVDKSTKIDNNCLENIKHANETSIIETYTSEKDSKKASSQNCEIFEHITEITSSSSASTSAYSSSSSSSSELLECEEEKKELTSLLSCSFMEIVPTRSSTPFSPMTSSQSSLLESSATLICHEGGNTIKKSENSNLNN